MTYPYPVPNEDIRILATLCNVDDVHCTVFLETILVTERVELLIWLGPEKLDVCF